MEIDEPKQDPDFTLQALSKQDLSTLSVGDLEERIASLKAEISRCESTLGERGSTRAEAEKLFRI